MRISDWSSDVCSSDLPCSRRARRAALLPFQGASFLLPSEVCADAEFPRPRIGFGLEQAITARPALISPIRRVVEVHELREELHLLDEAVFHRGVELEVRLDVASLLSDPAGTAEIARPVSTGEADAERPLLVAEIGRAHV